MDVSNDVAPLPEGPHRIQVDYKNIANAISIGSQILLDDGLIALKVTEIGPTDSSVTCVAMNGGPIKKNKGVNLPNTSVDLPALTQKDKQDLKWACQIGADYVAGRCMILHSLVLLHAEVWRLYLNFNNCKEGYNSNV